MNKYMEKLAYTLAVKVNKLDDDSKKRLVRSSRASGTVIGGAAAGLASHEAIRKSSIPRKGKFGALAGAMALGGVALGAYSGYRTGKAVDRHNRGVDMIDGAFAAGRASNEKKANVYLDKVAAKFTINMSGGDKVDMSEAEHNKYLKQFKKNPGVLTQLGGAIGGGLMGHMAGDLAAKSLGPRLHHAGKWGGAAAGYILGGKAGFDSAKHKAVVETFKKNKND